MKKRKQMTHQPHHIQIEGTTGTLTAYNKKDKPVVATFDAVDLPLIEKYPQWRSVWHSEFDCPVIESKNFNDGHATRTPLAAAILDCSPNAPIQHLNGDLLDVRRENLAIFDLKNTPNLYTITDNIATLTLKNRYGVVTGDAIIDKDKLEHVIKDGAVWLLKKRPSGQPFVVNTKGVLLAHYLLDVESGFIVYGNKNPLDNRMTNIAIGDL